MNAAIDPPRDPATPAAGADAHAPFAHAPPVVLVSHGFQINYERGFTNGLAARGARVLLLNSDWTDRAGLLPGVATRNLRGSQDVRRSKWQKLLNLARYHLALMGFVAGQREAVVHVMGLLAPPVLCGVVEGLWFRLWAARYVLTVHNLLPHERHTPWNKLVFGLSYRIPHILVVHTRRMKLDLCAGFSVAPSKVVVMEHGIEPRPLPSARAGTAKPAPARPAGNAPLKLLFFGRITAYKGLDVLLQALATIGTPFELLIAGTCVDGGLRQRLRSAIDAHAMASHIHWRDEFIAEAEVQALFDAADALVMPYLHIDQSGVLFQALRFGLPVIATKVGAFDDYVGHDVGELCAPADPADLARAIERLAGRRTALSRERIASIGRQYEWPQTVAVLGAAYQATTRHD